MSRWSGEARCPSWPLLWTRPSPRHPEARTARPPRWSCLFATRWFRRRRSSGRLRYGKAAYKPECPIWLVRPGLGRVRPPPAPGGQRADATGRRDRRGRCFAVGHVIERGSPVPFGSKEIPERPILCRDYGTVSFLPSPAPTLARLKAARAPQPVGPAPDAGWHKDAAE